MEATVKVLQQTHNHYDYYRETWEKIRDLKNGATALLKKKDKYIPRRPGEDEDIYKNRLESMSYTPVMNTQIGNLVSFLTSQPFQLDSDDQFWQEFITKLDGRSLDWGTLTESIYESLLYYGRVFLAVDTPSSQLSRSRYEYELNQEYPLVTIYEPLDVIRWGEGYDWVMTRVVSEVNNPLEPSTTIATWRLWTKFDVIKWSCLVRLDGDGQINSVFINGKWYDPASKKARLQGLVYPHTLGVCPIVHHEIEVNKWVGNAVFSKQHQHFTIESSWTWAGRYAGSIQRVFTPMAPTPTDNPMQVIEPPDYDNVITDNAHVLIGQGFSFVETTGGAINTLSGQLDKIESQIRDLVNMTFASAAREQSGVSKKIDMTLLVNALQVYGAKGLDIVKRVFELAAQRANRQPPDLRATNSYQLDDLDTYLTRSEQVAVQAPNMAPEAVREFYIKLQNALHPDADDALQQAIKDNTPTFEDDMTAEDPNNGDGVTVEELMAEFGLTEEEALEVINANQ